jgi:hypothetical protein
VQKQAIKTNMNSQTQQFIKILKHPVKFRMFLFMKLPAAFFSGIRIKQVTENECHVTVPFKWLTQNPFKSTYFASLSMAAELSTGALALACIYKSIPGISMLVVQVNSSYFKKATGITTFICQDGPAFKAAVEKAIDTKEGQTVIAHSAGYNKAGEKVAAFEITWSFKAKAA